jgi:hypothetical protein
MTTDIIKAGHPGFPDWAEGYWAVRRLDDDRWLVWGPLALGRSRIAVATEGGPEEHW